MSRGPAAAIVEALARPAIPNRGNFPAAPASVRRPRGPETRSREVVTVQPAAYGWACDACRSRGFGGWALLLHAETTGHRRYTPRGSRR